jgi:hypothetical protein
MATKSRMSTSHAADALSRGLGIKVSRVKVWRWCQAGQLEAIRVGSLIYVSAESVAGFIRSAQQPTARREVHR